MNGEGRMKQILHSDCCQAAVKTENWISKGGLYWFFDDTGSSFLI